MARLNLAGQATGEEREVLLESARTDVRAAIEELRDLAHGRHPAVLSERGLAAAVREIAEHSAVPVELLGLPGLSMSEVVETTAYYVIAEAVANAQKHARPDLIQVLAVASANGLRVEVTDDGVGGAVRSPGRASKG